ncbi:hypothetical protein Hypma_011907 [Hypsizygus marmoreus]|uniref:Uncharacterized protein n=1 Tax=Hypsizygus marmoreus TaxID=39966 RepID=A0A369JJH5_HYPMA|nr:hypothetical protein Hypma_011907 [Hypsizygus marmoreus]
MSYSGPMSRNRLLGMKNYLGKPSFTSSVGWKNSMGGNILIENALPVSPNVVADQDAYCVMVGEVSDYKLFTSPVGNYNPSYNVLHDAKFQLTLQRPRDADFGPDWSVAINNLQACQQIVATGNDCRNLIVPEGSEQSIRLSAPVMQSRAVPIPADGTLDEDTGTWPIPKTHQEAFDDIKRTHQVLPLMVYDMSGKYVLPEEVTSKISGALVEVHFRIKHYFINKTQSFNSFTGSIEQIAVLRQAIPKNPSPYRSRNKTGPYRPSSTPSRAELKRAADTFLPAPPDDMITKSAALPVASSPAASLFDTAGSSSSSIQHAAISIVDPAGSSSSSIQQGPNANTATTSGHGTASPSSSSSTLSDMPLPTGEGEEMTGEEEEPENSQAPAEGGSPPKKRKLRR